MTGVQTCALPIYAFIRRDVDHPSDDAASVLAVLVFDELAFQAQGELVDHRCVHGFGPAGGQPGAGQLVRNLVPGFHAEIVGLRHVGGVGDADSECAPGLDIFDCLVGFGQVEGHGAPLLHGAPGGVHHVDAAVLVADLM